MSCSLFEKMDNALPDSLSAVPRRLHLPVRRGMIGRLPGYTKRVSLYLVYWILGEEQGSDGAPPSRILLLVGPSNAEPVMKITFPCTRCGKTLKARENAVGRTRKCPICATRVTCPEPVYTAQVFDGEVVDAEVFDAEVVDAEVVAVAAPVADRPAVDPYADIDDGGAYDVVAPDSGADSQVEPRRPCPMCGETILASAVKCRFCGEVFDSVLKKGKSKGKKSGKRSSRPSGGGNPDAVRDLGVGILVTALGIGLTVFSFANAVENSKGDGKFFVFYGLVFGGIGGICKGIYGMVRSD